ncbi:MAG: hypothetical protein IJU52_04405 [Clostridia bacterium]|nr:hypothetical protein [Clostridia bacterium]
MKKIIAFVLTALMVIGMIPVTALIASADTPPVGAHTKAVVGEYVDPDTQATVDCFTVIGFVAKDKIDDMEFLDMDVKVYPYGSDKSNPVNSFHKAFTKVFSSLKDIAATDQNTALTQNVEYVDVPDVYIFGLTVYGVPQGLYTIDVTVTGRSVTGAPIDGLVGKAEDVSFGVDDELPAEIVDAAYALTDGTLENKTLTGKIVDIGTAYSTQYENITVTIAVAGRENKPIQCYRLKGAAATDTTPAVDISGLALFDTITVTGTLKNYKGTIEFDQGCVCSAIVKSTSNVPAALDAITLEQTYNPGDAVTPAAGNQYPDVTFTYAAAVAEGDAPVVIDNGTLTFGDVTAATQITVTVTATDGTETLSKEFNVSLVPAGHTETMQDIVDAAYALAPGASLAEQKTLQGVITEITTAYSAQYGNVTVVIAVADRTDKPIQCYRMKNGSAITAGEGVEVIKVGDTITVTGTLKNYSGTIEFDKNCTLDSIDAAAQLTDEQKVEAEKDALNVTIADGTALPTTGATYTDVAIDWESNNAMVAVDSGAVVINNTLQAGDEDVTVTVTATLWLNDAEMTKTFTVVLKAPSAQAVTTVVVVSGDLGYANAEEVQTITADSVVTITYDKANGTNAPKYYTTGTAIRAYSGNTITISGTKKITKIVLNFAGTGYTGSMTLDGYSCDSVVGTWTGNADSVTFTVGTTQARIVSFEITYGDEDANQGGTTPTVTDAEKVQAEYDALNVVIENGTVLPSVGTTYADVAITWASDNEMVTLTGGVVAINNTLTFTDSDVTVTVTAALSIGETVQNKTFTVKLKAPQQGNDPAQAVKDTLTAALFAAASTTYTNFANVSATSDAVYAGQSAKTTGGAIQLRSKNSNSGIVTTTTGGKVVSITVKFESGSNTLDIYGSNTAYTDATDLYDSNKQGTKIGSINADGTVTVEGDYTYIGFRSSNGALYITSIEIEWA